MLAGAMSGSPERALIGRRVDGKYVVEELLGGGSMGSVYRAREPALERNVAIKVLHRALLNDPTFSRRFKQEARAASSFEHPNSIRILSFGQESDGLLYLVMEYVQGRDLGRVLQEDWPLSDALVVDILTQTLSALARAHDAGLIHRDLKPENLMILRVPDDDDPRTERYAVKVCDFGIAKVALSDENSPDGVTERGIVVGTPEYMSPEQARGQAVDARSDLYSVGVILFQLLTGRTPFLGDSAVGVVLQQIAAPVPLPQTLRPGVHQGLAEVCVRALSKSPEARYQSAREMRLAIRTALRPSEWTDSLSTDVSELLGNGSRLTRRDSGTTGLDPEMTAAVEAWDQKRPLLSESIGARGGGRGLAAIAFGVAGLALVGGLGLVFLGPAGTSLRLGPSTSPAAGSAVIANRGVPSAMVAPTSVPPVVPTPRAQSRIEGPRVRLLAARNPKRPKEVETPRSPDDASSPPPERASEPPSSASGPPSPDPVQRIEPSEPPEAREAREPGVPAANEELLPLPGPTTPGSATHDGGASGG